MQGNDKILAMKFLYYMSLCRERREKMEYFKKVITLKNNYKKKVLKVGLSLVMVMFMVVSTLEISNANAIEPALNVNGVNILNDVDGVVQCGAGSATYSKIDNTLTLNNATITESAIDYFESGYADSRAGISGNVDINIVLKGTNTIKSETLISGISLYNQNVSITGEGTLNIVTNLSETDANGFHVRYGIKANKLSIDGVRISIISQGVDSINESDAGIAFLREFKIKNASLSINKMCDGIVGDHTVCQLLAIDNSEIVMKDIKTNGINFSNGEGDPSLDKSSQINDSKIEISSEKNSLALMNANFSNSQLIVNSQANAIYVKGYINVKNNSTITTNSKFSGLKSTRNMTISDSDIDSTSTGGGSIYSQQDLSITGSSKVVSKSLNVGIFVVGNLVIEDASINATSSNDIAIWSKSSINIKSGDIYAKGRADTAAIAVRRTNKNIEDISAYISIDENYADIKNAKLSLSEKNHDDQSFVSFVAEDEENKLQTNWSNAVKEVHIKVKPANYSRVDQAKGNIPSDLSYYTNESVQVLNDAVDAVEEGKSILEQDVVDGYVKAINDAISRLKLKKSEEILSPKVSAYEYSSTKKLSSISLGGSWQWEDGSVILDAGIHDVKIYMNVDDTKCDYSEIEGYDKTNHRIERTIKVQVNKLKNTWTQELNMDDWFYGDQAQKPQASSKYGDVVYTYSQDRNGIYTSKVPSEIGVYFVKASVNGTKTYEGLSAIKSFEIKQKVSIKWEGQVDVQVQLKDDVIDALKKDAQTIIGDDAQYNIECVLTPMNEEKLFQDYFQDDQKEDTKIGMCFDVSIFIKDHNQKTVGQIHETSEKLSFVLEIPKELYAENRAYSIYREHNGVIETVSSIQKGNQLIFESDKFSTYVLTYTEKPVEDSNQVKDKNVETYDSSYLPLFTSLLTISFLSLCLLHKKKYESS